MPNASVTFKKPNSSKLRTSLKVKKNWLKEFNSTDYPGRVRTREYYENLEKINELQSQLKYTRKGGGCG